MTEVHEALFKAGIIPNVISEFQPVLGLSASWSDDASASLGNTLDPSALASAPSVRLEKAESTSRRATGTSYVLALTDPDAPSRDNPKWSEFCHWIATGLSISSGASSLEDVLEYKPPAPPEKTGPHRYVFIAFVPANGTTEKLNLTKPKDRKHWGASAPGHGVKDWAYANGLVPIAANFIYAQNKKQGESWPPIPPAPTPNANRVSGVQTRQQALAKGFTEEDVDGAETLMMMSRSNESWTPIPSSETAEATNTAETTDVAESTDVTDVTGGTSDETVSPNASNTDDVTDDTSSPSNLGDSEDADAVVSAENQTDTIATPTGPRERSPKTTSAIVKADYIKSLDCDALTRCDRCASKRNPNHRCLIDPDTRFSACETCTRQKEGCQFVKNGSVAKDPARRPRKAVKGHVTTIDRAASMLAAQQAPPEITESERKEVAAFNLERSDRDATTPDEVASGVKPEVRDEDVSNKKKRTPLPTSQPRRKRGGFPRRR
ncbi:hypothetical protein ACHAQA_009541 [Verticillium albo-atrum]